MGIGPAPGAGSERDGERDRDRGRHHVCDRDQHQDWDRDWGRTGTGTGTGTEPGRSMCGWRDMPAEALEHQYSPSRWSPRLGTDTVIQAHIAATAAGTRRARAAAQTSLHVPYGDGDGEKLDVYFPADPSGTFPVLVYIHGGYWQCLRGLYLCGHSAGAHLAAMVLSTDWTEFGVVPDIKGAVLVSGIYDLEPILHTYVNDALNMSREVAQRNSPMLRVAPAAPAAAACEVLVAVAQHDSPEFRRQSQEYGQVSSGEQPAQLRRDAAPAGPLSWGEEPVGRARAVFLLLCDGCCRRRWRLRGRRRSLPSCRCCGPVRGGWGSGSLLPVPLSPQALRAAGWSVSMLDLAGVDHFDIIEKLSEESYILTQVILNMISKA
ncbi:kynurenine formamidase isoform X2 [Tyto alba]|uniref:kynurenine formamidase isoform X2 n=1 Tax=Tyto alba TaxID=56313 RepID=UPI001C669CA6|nr:kynurenine formamidase isoform X2 [Tyto alba]